MTKLDDSLELEDALKLDNQLCFALYGLSRKMTSLYRPLLKPLGLTYPQYLVMMVMWEAQAGHAMEEFEGTPIKEIGKRLLLDTGTLTPLLKRLEMQNYLTRTRSKHDEREVRVALSHEGVQLKEAAKHIPLQMLCQSPLAPERLLGLQRELKALLQQFQDAD